MCVPIGSTVPGPGENENVPRTSADALNSAELTGVPAAIFNGGTTVTTGRSSALTRKLVVTLASRYVAVSAGVKSPVSVCTPIGSTVAAGGEYEKVPGTSAMAFS